MYTLNKARAAQSQGRDQTSEPDGGVGDSVTSTFFMSESVHRLVYSEERRGNKNP